MRLLIDIVQARLDGLTVVTEDTQFSAYGVTILW